MVGSLISEASIPRETSGNAARATPQAQAGERTVREVLDTVPRSQWRDGYFGPRDSNRGEPVGRHRFFDKYKLAMEDMAIYIHIQICIRKKHL